MGTSVLLQFATHLSLLIYSVRLANDFAPQGKTR
jgi:hypothetical protein